MFFAILLWKHARTCVWLSTRLYIMYRTLLFKSLCELYVFLSPAILSVSVCVLKRVNSGTIPILKLTQEEHK